MRQGTRSEATARPRAQAGKPYARSHLLVIGIDKYPKSSNLDELSCAVNDANAVADLLISNFGFDASRTVRLRNSEATKARILSELTRLTKPSVAGEDDRIVVFFACHGASVKQGREESEGGFLVPYDGKVDPRDPSDPSTYLGSCIRMHELWELLGYSSAKHILVIADACFGGLINSRGPSLARADIPHYLAQTAHVVITAGNATEKSHENIALGHGLFTRCLLDAFASLSDRTTGFTSSDLYEALKYPVQQLSGSKQHPVLDHLSGPDHEVLFFPTKAVVTPKVESKVAPAAPSRSDTAPTSRRPLLKAGLATVLIPAGEFTMGAEGEPRVGPERKVHLDAYWIGINAVTVGQFRQFTTDPLGYRKEFGVAFPWKDREPDWKWDREDLPMVCVTWKEARAFCNWAGGDLPTEAQWEKAARGEKGFEFPWGPTWDSAKVVASEDAIGDRSSPMPVGSLSAGASPYGCLDMQGNVSQWCLDFYDPSGYGALPANNPVNEVSGPSKERVVRGGHFKCIGRNGSEFRNFGRLAYDPATKISTIGFRVAAAGSN